MKKILTGIFLALIALMLVVSPVLADGGNADVDCSDIEVSDDAPAVGTTITYHGTVTIVANASSTTDYWYSSWSKGWTVAGAESTAWYEVRDPNGNIIATDSCALGDYNEGVVGDAGWGGAHYYYCFDDAEADAGQIFDWSVDIPIDLVGDYTATQGGEATIYYGSWTQTGHCEWGGCGYVWVWDEPVLHETTITDACTTEKTVTSHKNVQFLLWNSSPNVLWIQAPSPEGHIYLDQHRGVFHGYDGWDEPTDALIVYSDGVWQVEVPVGTLIELDGKWHSFTIIEIDDQGMPTFKYGKTHTVATDIGLSQPITITKVG